MTRIQMDLPDSIAQDAQAAGLLSNALARQRAADYLLAIADAVAATGAAPMSMDEITAEVKAARGKRKEHESKPHPALRLQMGTQG